MPMRRNEFLYGIIVVHRAGAARIERGDQPQKDRPPIGEANAFRHDAGSADAGRVYDALQMKPTYAGFSDTRRMQTSV
jgi:hypothetical protein